MDAPTAEQILAAFGLAGCAVAAGAWALGPARRARLRRAWQALDLRDRLRRGVRTPAQRRQARRAADAAIDRARRGHWDGNVFKPDAFGPRREDEEPPHRH